MPGVILAVTPERETSSAMSFNKVVRSVAFSLGSAFGSLMLAGGTNTGRSSPVDGAETTAALIGVCRITGARLGASAYIPRAGARQPSEQSPP